MESCTDPSVFIYKKGSCELFLCVYVDDIVITSSNDNEISRVLDLLSVDFPIRDLGDLNFFLGIEVNRTKQGLHLSQP